MRSHGLLLQKVVRVGVRGRVSGGDQGSAITVNQRSVESSGGVRRVRSDGGGSVRGGVSGSGQKGSRSDDGSSDHWTPSGGSGGVNSASEGGGDLSSGSVVEVTKDVSGVQGGGRERGSDHAGEGNDENDFGHFRLRRVDCPFRMDAKRE